MHELHTSAALGQWPVQVGMPAIQQVHGDNILVDCYV